ncbi:MAG TPA: double-strand break repair helicase AddA, partial [Erythrobacter sp.]|nr:double-strand break repair helicase AddA [Erythrobacter sp.]
WSAKTGQTCADFLESWLASDTDARLAAINGFSKTLLKADGTPRKMAGAEKVDPDFPGNQERVAEAVAKVRERAALLELAAFLGPQLEAGRAFALAWHRAKEREGLVDFDDLIARAATLLSDSAMADWIRYKLDRSFDHILVDEAQDTNAAQWAIVKALTDDYFDGSGARGEAVRTIFAVGDYKQAIFGFQGTSPENFRQARDFFRDKMNAAADAARDTR